MSSGHAEAPEVIHDYPEVHHPPSAPEVSPYSYPPEVIPTKPEDTALYSGHTLPYNNAGTYGVDGNSQAYMYGGTQGGQPPTDAEQKPRRMAICGCSMVVFILSIIVAILSAAVIGLAVGTGVESNRARNAETRLEAATSTNATAQNTNTTSTVGFDSLDRNCSSNPGSVTGTSYTTKYFNKTQYMVWCNTDTPHNPLQSLFVGNFDDCIDACAFYSHYTPLAFGNASVTNQTCAGVSFIPAWTDRDFAFKGGAPGNCYLKPGPINRSDLREPNIGTECHAAVIDD